MLNEFIRDLRGKDSYLEFSRRTGVNRITLMQAETGERIRLSTLQTLAENLKLEKGRFTEMLIAWIRAEIGDDNSALLEIRPANEGLSEISNQGEKLAMCCFNRLAPSEKAEVLKAMMRREVLACLPPINRLYDIQCGSDLDRVFEHDAPVPIQDFIALLAAEKDPVRVRKAKSGKKRPR